MTASLLSVLLPATTTAQTDIWNLESAIQHALEIAPEMRAAEAEVAAREGELTQAGNWPNPSIDLRADDKLGQEDGRGGTDFTQLVISQPLPLRRLARQRVAAEARLSGVEAERRLRRLELERETARDFHALQLAQARLRLAHERVEQTDTYPGVSRRASGERLKRYIVPLDRARLDLLHEETHQAVSVAEREHEQALIAFRARLALAVDAVAETTPLAEPPAPPLFEALERNLETHPVLTAARREQEAAEADIAAAQSQRFTDPALNLFREREILAGSRRDVTGVGLSVQVPLWNTNPGVVDKARADALRARTEFDIARREALARLRRCHAELMRVRAQAERVRASLLKPAQRLNELAQRSFSAGEANVLALIDAANSYFDAQARYVELLVQAQEVAADLRLAAGQSVLASEAAP